MSLCGTNIIVSLKEVYFNGEHDSRPVLLARRNIMKIFKYNVINTVGLHINDNQSRS